MRPLATSVLVTGATLAGLSGVLVLNRTSAPVAGASTADAASPQTTTASSSAAGPSGSAAPSSATSPSASAASPSTGTTTTYAGSTYNTPYGPVQVTITVRDGSMTEISLDQVPSGNHSDQINSYAGPLLVEEALSAQSAQVDTISGATYTSEGFRRSLESALTKAGL